MRINQPIIGNKNRNSKSNCLHNNCTQCHGTGVKKNGQPCHHMISCPCDICSPWNYDSQIIYTNKAPVKWRFPDRY